MEKFSLLGVLEFMLLVYVELELWNVDNYKVRRTGYLESFIGPDFSIIILSDKRWKLLKSILQRIPLFAQSLITWSGVNNHIPYLFSPIYSEPDSVPAAFL